MVKEPVDALPVGFVRRTLRVVRLATILGAYPRWAVEYPFGTTASTHRMSLPLLCLHRRRPDASITALMPPGLRPRDIEWSKLARHPAKSSFLEVNLPNDATSSDLGYADTLWRSADALRGQVDAAEYKHVVLGLLFLKYISDSFESRRQQLKAELEKDGIMVSSSNPCWRAATSTRPSGYSGSRPRRAGPSSRTRRPAPTSPR